MEKFDQNNFDKARRYYASGNYKEASIILGELLQND